MYIYVYECMYICEYNTHMYDVAHAGSPVCLAAARVRFTPARAGFTAAGSSSALSSASPNSCLQVMHKLW